MTAARLLQQKQATVNAQGVASFTFDPPPLGSISTGTLSVFNSDNGTLWQLLLSGQQIYTIIGNNPCANVQAWPNETLTLTASGLKPGTIYTASWIGITDDASNVDIVFPGGTQQVINSAAIRVAASSRQSNLPQNASDTITVPLLPNERSIVLLGKFTNAPGSSTLLVDVIGNVTGNAYAGREQWPFVVLQSAAGARLPPFTIPAYGIEDTSIQITITNTNVQENDILWSVLAMPDEVILGSEGNSLLAVAGSQPMGFGAGSDGNGFQVNYTPVTIFDPVFQQVMGTPKRPLNVTLSDASAATASTATGWVNGRSANAVATTLYTVSSITTKIWGFQLSASTSVTTEAAALLSNGGVNFAELAFFGQAGRGDTELWFPGGIALNNGTTIILNSPNPGVALATVFISTS